MRVKCGQIVVLKSGGPWMTVSQISADSETVYCRWFAGVEVQTGAFTPAALWAIVIDADGQQHMEPLAA